VELRERREAEEDVHDVRRQVDARFPFLSQNSAGRIVMNLSVCKR
jgi:hypothetical protein